MAPGKRNFIIIAALLVVALAVAIASVPYRARRAVESYQAQLLASGEKLNPEQLWPVAPPLERNGAPLFRQVMWNWTRSTNLLDKNAPVAMRAVAPGKAAVGWAQPDIHSGSATNTWEEIESALSRFDSSLDDVRLAAQRPVFNFGLDYRQGPSLLLPHLAPLKHSVQLLTTAELCDLHRGNVMAASTNVEIMLALVHATSTEPFTISQLVRIAMAQIAMTATWELLQSTNLTDAQLAAIQHDWSGLDFIRPGEQSVEFERAFGQMTISRMRDSSAQFRQVLSLGGSGGSASAAPLPIQFGERLLREMVIETRETRWRLSQSYPDQLKALKGYQVLLQTFRQLEAGQSFVEAIRRQQGALDELGLQPPADDNFRLFDLNGPDLRTLFSGSISSLGRVCERVFNAEVARDLTTTALALKRYQLAHGNYPSDLSSLVPSLLPSIPRDPADCRPLRYRLKPDGKFLLYSIGPDGVDNGGDPSPADNKTRSVGWLRGRDLVWPNPGMPEGLAQTHPAGTADQPDRPL